MGMALLRLHPKVQQGLRLQAYKEEESKRSSGRIRLPDGRPIWKKKEKVKAYLQPREPESEEEVENMAVGGKK